MAEFEAGEVVERHHQKRDEFGLAQAEPENETQDEVGLVDFDANRCRRQTLRDRSKEQKL